MESIFKDEESGAQEREVTTLFKDEGGKIKGLFQKFENFYEIFYALLNAYVLDLGYLDLIKGAAWMKQFRK